MPTSYTAGMFRDLLNGPWTDLLEVYPAKRSNAQSFQAMDEGAPGSGGDETPDSAATPLFCPDVAAIEAAYQANGPAFIEADCMPISIPTDTTFTLLDSDPNSQNSILVYWTQSSNLASSGEMVNTMTATVQADSTGTNFWLECDSGPDWTQGETVGVVNAVPQLDMVAYAATVLPDSADQVTIDGVIVTAGQGDFGGALYVEAARQAQGQWGGIRVVTNADYPRGETLNITGQAVLGTDGESRSSRLRSPPPAR